MDGETVGNWILEVGTRLFEEARPGRVMLRFWISAFSVSCLGPPAQGSLPGLPSWEQEAEISH